MVDTNTRLCVGEEDEGYNMANKSRLTKVLGRYKKQELLEDAPDLLGLDRSYYSERKLQALSRKTKRELVSSLVDDCLEVNVSDVDILDLELHYAVTHPHSLTWKVYKLERSESTISVADSDAKVFCKRFQFYFNKSFNYQFTQDLKAPGHWLCLRIQECGSKKPPYTCYALRCLPTPFVLLSGVKKHHTDLVLESIALSLDCHDCTDLNLSGKNLSSLIDSLVYQHCQGAYSQYRFNQVDPNPLLGVAAASCRKRSKLITDLENKEEIETNNPVKRPRKVADEAFGTNPLPRLEKFSIQLKSMSLPDSNESTTCKLKFSGLNVLEGLKESVVCDCVSLPVPIVLKSLPRCSTNRVTVEMSNERDPPLSNQTLDIDLENNENG